MQNDERIFQIPYGTRDFLPVEAAEKREVEMKLARVFSLWGYDEIVTPTIEYLDTLKTGNGAHVEPHMFKFLDKNNRTLALRHEMTTPIARVVAGRLQDEDRPLRLSYISSVYRYEQTQADRQCEFNQAGVEFIGERSAMADCEVLALAIKSIKKSGIRNFRVYLGQVDFINGIMEHYGLSEESKRQIKKALEKHNLVAMGEIVDALAVSEECKKLLKKIPLLRGGRAIIDEAYSMVTNEKSRAALDNLKEIYSLLEMYEVTDWVQIDLDVIRDFDYYTGMVFEVFSPGLGSPICGGGRYDKMLNDFLADCPATGFAIGIERLMLALEHEGLKKPLIRKDIYVSYVAGKEEEAIMMAEKLRSDQFIVTLSSKPQTEEEANVSKDKRNCAQLIHLK